MTYLPVCSARVHESAKQPKVEEDGTPGGIVNPRTGATQNLDWKCMI
jgi:hypothetical protein